MFSHRPTIRAGTLRPDILPAEWRWHERRRWHGVAPSVCGLLRSRAVSPLPCFRTAMAMAFAPPTSRQVSIGRRSRRRACSSSFQVWTSGFPHSRQPRAPCSLARRTSSHLRRSARRRPERFTSATGVDRSGLCECSEPPGAHAYCGTTRGRETGLLRSNGVVERRRTARRLVAADEPLSQIRLRAGRQLGVIDISESGLLAEGEMRLLPGTHVDVHLVTDEGRLLIRSRVVRAFVCHVSASTIRYRGALAFDRPVQTTVETTVAGYGLPGGPNGLAVAEGNPYPGSTPPSTLSSVSHSSG